MALNNLGNIVYELGDLAAAQRLYEESLALRESIGDRGGMADSLNNLGMLATARGESGTRPASASTRDRDQDRDGRAVYSAPTWNNLRRGHPRGRRWTGAREHNERALALGREAGNTRRVAHSLHNIGLAHRCRGDDAAAKALYEASLELFREVGEQSGVAAVLHSLGRVAARHGAMDQAAQHYAGALELHRRVLDRRGLVRCLLGAALLAEGGGDHDAFARLHGAARTIAATWCHSSRRWSGTTSRARKRGRDRCSGPPGMMPAVAIGVAHPRAGDRHGGQRAGGERLRRVDAEPSRARGVAADGAGPLQPGDRRRALHRRPHGQDSRHEIFTKLDVASRSAAVAWAHRHEMA